jgi:HEAT repeat protein
VELLESPSRRIQRIAAIALTRERNPAAVKHLQGLLERESSDLGRIEIAQALARAGEARGFEVLREALGNAQRDVRLDAARALVELGDPSGAKQLTAMLSISGYRVGAAGLLARLGDQKAMEVLREELRLADATEESRMRAAVALGRAGDASVRQTLLTILDDGRYNVGAADALAALGERQAEAALVRQLNLASLRVGAAEALRRLGSKLDLGPLAVALESGDDVGRVSAAEAILILASSEGGAGSH